jgi:endonuclease YncB( thermonuclease family)
MYKAKITRVVDGDTFDAVVDMGCRISLNMRIRLHDVDTPETWRPTTEKEREHGEKATKFVKNLIENKDVVIKTYKAGIYNRYECDVFIDDINMSDLLKENDLVKRDCYQDEEVL